MNILETIQSKIGELGIEQTGALLGVETNVVKSWFYVGKRKKTPSFDIAEKVFDLWIKSNGHAKVQDFEFHEKEEDDIQNISLKIDSTKTWTFKERDVCLVFPVYKAVEYESFMTFMALAKKYKDDLCMEFRGKDSMITRSRNQLAKRFLKTGASWSIWLDDDMVVPFGHSGIFATLTGMHHVPEKYLGMNIVERLISHGRSIVGACYWDRTGRGRLIAGGKDPILTPIPYDTLVSVNFVGTGCLAIHRKVFEDIAEKFPETMSEESLGNETGFFTNIQTPQRMMGEDESFAWRATEAGHPSYLDLGAICGHVGNSVHGMPASGSKI